MSIGAEQDLLVGIGQLRHERHGGLDLAGFRLIEGKRFGQAQLVVLERQRAVSQVHVGPQSLFHLLRAHALRFADHAGQADTLALTRVEEFEIDDLMATIWMLDVHAAGEQLPSALGADFSQNIGKRFAVNHVALLSSAHSLFYTPGSMALRERATGPSVAGARLWRHPQHTLRASESCDTVDPVMSEVVVTLDIDWAPDFAIDAVAKVLRDAGVASTWFVTHTSPAVERLRADRDLIELGIHPNFLPGSDHGSSTEEVLRHCMKLVPEARSVRTHALVQSHHILEAIVVETPVRLDLSIFLPGMAHIAPVKYAVHGDDLLRIAYYWEDDDQTMQPDPVWSFEPHWGVAGIRILDFHPMHVYLNSKDRSAYESVKELMPLQELTPDDVAPFVNHGQGARSVFEEVVARLAEARESLRVHDLEKRYRNPGGAA